MVKALRNNGAEYVYKRATVDEEEIQNKCVENFISVNTMKFFTSMGINTKFLDIDPNDWCVDSDYIAGEKCVKSLSVVNDLAEHSVALMEEYNALHTCDEDQKQYLLQVVGDHRKQFPDFKKKNL